MANTETTINAVIHPKYNDTPIDIEKTIKALERNNFVVHYFETGTEAISYLKDRIQNKHVAIGDSRTLLKLNAYEALSEVNEDVTDIQRPLLGESFATPHCVPWVVMYSLPQSMLLLKRGKWSILMVRVIVLPPHSLALKRYFLC